MAVYCKSLEDYFRIPVLIKTITPLTPSSQQKIAKSLYYKYYSLPIDERYARQQHNPNTQILTIREHCTQKFYFTPEQFFSDWPQFQVIYKIKFAIGVIDQYSDQKQVQQILGRMRNQHNFKFIGILDMGMSQCQNLFKKQNILKYPDVQDLEFAHFIEPWLYNCLSCVESQICNIIIEAKKDDETNRTIVFNQKQDKFDPKIMKRKKKYRCIKLCGDYHLMLQLYKEAFAYFGDAEEQLRKLDDYMWILGAIQGKLACTVVCQNLNLSNHQQYIDALISQTYVVAKKTKNLNFQTENHLKIARLYLNQPDKLDQLVRAFLTAYTKNLNQDEKFLLYTVIGELYGKCRLVRKKNMYYFLASLIHIGKKAQFSELLLIQIQKSKQIRHYPYLYKNILQMIISESEKGQKTNQYYLQLLSKCGNNLSQRQIQSTLSQLNFNNHPIYELQNIDFIRLKDFSVIQSKTKPKQNRIGSRQSPKKIGPGFFMSWKKDQNLLFQQKQQIIFKGILFNSILFPIRLKISFQVCSLANSQKRLSNQQLFFYLQPNSSHKFQQKIRLKSTPTQQIWVIDRIYFYVWNFKSNVVLPNPIKLQLYQKQPQLDLCVQKEIKCEQSSCLNLQLGLKTHSRSVPFCLIKLNISIYYSVDVGFQQNQIYLKQQNNFNGIDFSNPFNLKIIQSKTRDQVGLESVNGIITIYLKKLKVHRKFVSRIEFTLEYIRSLNTKYQTSKHYISKCLFYQQFSYQVQQVSTPIINQIYKNPLSHLKIIEKYYKVKLRVTKLTTSQSSNSYIIYHQGKQYRFKYQNFLIIEILKQKIAIQNSNQQPPQPKQIIKWQNIFHKHQKGEVQLSIPFDQIMIKCQKSVNLKIVNIQSSKQKNKQKTIQYVIQSSKPLSLSHFITLNPLQLQIDRMYVLKGKNKVESQHSTAVSNTLMVTSSQKCKNSYQIGIIFKDGWIYWHDQLLTFP